MAVVSKGWTYSLNAGSISINQALGLTNVSVYAESGDVTITGSLQVGSYPSAPIVVPEGITVNLNDKGNSTNILDGYTISTAGVAVLIGG